MCQPVSDPACPASPADQAASGVLANVPSTPAHHNGIKASDASLSALSWVNFLAALMQAGFGAFLVAYLTQQYWTRTSIGFVLSAAMVAAMVSQVPGGMVVDWAPSKRWAAAGAVSAIMTASMLVAWAPLPVPVCLAVVLHSAAVAVLVPAVAALTLSLSREERLGERFGRNVRFAAFGSALAAAIMGAIGAWLSYRAIYCFAALCALPGLAAIFCIRATDLKSAHKRSSHAASAHPRHGAPPQRSLSEVFRDPALLAFAALGTAFQLGNTGMLPVATGAIARSFQGLPDPILSSFAPFLPHMQIRISVLVVSAWIVVPQLLAALLAPRIGRAAQVRSRRYMLLIGVGTLPIRATLFALEPSPILMIASQMLDGIATTILGIMVPMVVADITHRGGRFNLAIGILGLASGIGAACSMALAGVLADRIGDTGTFLVLGGIGVIALFLLMVFMPDTQHMPHPTSLGAQPHSHPGAYRYADHHEAAHRHGAPSQRDHAPRVNPRG